jgi:hypothetical protein
MFRNIFAVFLSFSLIAAVVRPVAAQSLADLSKQEEDRRKGIRAPAKVYTNKDLGNVPAAPSGEAPPQSGEPAKDGAKDGVKNGSKDPSRDKETDKKAADQEKDVAKPGASDGPKDQAYWSGRLRALQTQLDRDQSFGEALQSRINALTTDFANRSDPAQRAVVDRDRAKALTELDRLKQAIQNDKKAITDLQEEARRAGVPAGWLR